MGVKVVTPGCCFQSPIIPHSQTLLRRARSFHRPSRAHTIIRSCSASLDPSSSSFSSFSFDEDFFSRQIHDHLAFATAVDPSFLVPPVPPAWHGRAGEETVIQRKANSVEIPLSLRIIKRKLKWEENLTDAGESAYCSMKKAFSSMVFIVRELHSYSLLQMREAVSSTRGDLQPTLARVHRELHASFVWLFQSVFSHTPALMVSVMILLANFSVYSMDSHVAAAAPPPLTAEVQIAAETKYFDSSSSSPSSRLTVPLDGSNVAFFGGDGGRGGSSQPLTSGTEGDGVGAAESRPAAARDDEEASEARLWDEIVDDARRMEASARGVLLDPEIVKRFVSPVTARIEPDDVEDYFRTELVYQVWLTQDPNNPLLLANYAQFLYLVAHDYDRAEEYFKRAVKVEPKDAEAISKYASFLWMARKDLWAAEETFLEAISADPNNSFYAANYAHFLWNTGGEDTCFPLDSPDQEEL